MAGSKLRVTLILIQATHFFLFVHPCGQTVKTFAHYIDLYFIFVSYLFSLFYACFYLIKDLKDLWFVFRNLNNLVGVVVPGLKLVSRTLMCSGPDWSEVKMPFKCVVPGCRSNYVHERGMRSVPMLKFPTEPDMVAAWVEAIHRPGFIPTPHSHVCLKHFRPEQQVWKEYHRQADGSYRDVIRRHAKLLPGTVPSVFDVDPSQWKPRSRRKQIRLSPKPDMKSSGSCEIITGYKVRRESRECK